MPAVTSAACECVEEVEEDATEERVDDEEEGGGATAAEPEGSLPL